MRVSGSIRVAANGIIWFFFTAEWYSSVYIYHIFLIHSPVDGHLGCFHVLASVTSAPVNTHGCMCLFQGKFCVDISPGVGLLGHMVVLHLVS